MFGMHACMRRPIIIYSSCPSVSNILLLHCYRCTTTRLDLELSYAIVLLCCTVWDISYMYDIVRIPINSFASATTT